MNRKTVYLSILTCLLVIGLGGFSTAKAERPLRSGLRLSQGDSPTSIPDAQTPTPPSSVQTIIFQNGVSPTTAYSGTSDAIITTWNGNSYANLGGLDYLQVGESGDADQFRFLMRFDLSGWLNPHAQILQAWLELRSYDGGFDDVAQDVSVHRAGQAWQEGDGQDLFGDGREQGVTWVTARPGVAWTTPGGDFEEAALDQVQVPANADDWQRWDVTAAVRDWLAQPSDNFGLLAQPDAAPWMHHEFRSSEYSVAELRPRLIISLQQPIFLPWILCEIPQSPATPSQKLLVHIPGDWRPD